jgi:hypothetical protein
MIFLFQQPTPQPTSNWLDYVTLIVGIFTCLAVLVSFLTIVFNVCIAIGSLVLTKHLHTKSFKDEYNKQLIAKRLDAYESLEKILFKLNSKKNMYLTAIAIDSGRKKTIEKLCHVFVETPTSMKSFKDEYNEMAAKTVWFSEEIVIEIFILNKILLEVTERLVDNDKNKNLVLGTDYHDQINTHYLRLLQLFIDDYKELHDIEKFINERSKRLASIPLDS